MLIHDVIQKIKFNDWTFRVEDREGGHLLQVQFYAPCNVAGGKPELQNCRKWYVSKYACENEIVRTAWKAVLHAVEHETAENFLYDGERIFDPHIDYSKLAEFLKTKPFNMRN